MKNRMVALPFFLSLIFVNLSFGGIIKISVFEKDLPAKGGFECEVYIKSNKADRNCFYESGKDECIGYIYNKGFEEFELNCKAGERVLIKPTYMNMDPQCIRCPLNKELKVGFTSRELLKNILSSAQSAISDNNYAAASLAFLELASRVTEYQGKKSFEFETQAYEYASKYFDIPFDRAFQYDLKNEKIIMLESLSKKIATFQRTNKVSVKKAGRLDAKTLMAAGNVKTYQILYDLKEIPTPLIMDTDSLKSVDINQIASFLPNKSANKIKGVLTKASEYEKISPAQATLAYNNALAVIKKINAPPDKKSQWENEIGTKVYTNFGNYLNVDSAFSYDPTQNKNVMTYEMKKAVKAFQINSKIKVTGKIDSETLSKAVKAPSLL